MGKTVIEWTDYTFNRSTIDMTGRHRWSGPSRTPRGGSSSCDALTVYARLTVRGVNPKTGRPGPAPLPPRDGDRKQARQRINVEVRTGRRPHPNTLPCVDCGHIWRPSERRHEYDHHLGYSAEHHYDVQSVCTQCHAQRALVRREFVPLNWTGRKRPGQNDNRLRRADGTFMKGGVSRGRE